MKPLKNSFEGISKEMIGRASVAVQEYRSRNAHPGYPHAVAVKRGSPLLRIRLLPVRFDLKHKDRRVFLGRIPTPFVYRQMRTFFITWKDITCKGWGGR